MYVIGISSGIKHGHHDGAAVLLRDGELVAAAEEERFTLAHHARGKLPRGAIGFCLKQAGITMRDVDWICSPLKTFTNYAQPLTEYFKYQFGHSPKIELYDHHLCEDGGDLGSAAAARPTARPAPDRHRRERPKQLEIVTTEVDPHSDSKDRLRRRLHRRRRRTEPAR